MSLCYCWDCFNLSIQWLYIGQKRVIKNPPILVHIMFYGRVLIAVHCSKFFFFFLGNRQLLQHWQWKRRRSCFSVSLVTLCLPWWHVIFMWYPHSERCPGILTTDTQSSGLRSGLSHSYFSWGKEGFLFDNAIHMDQTDGIQPFPMLIE